MLFWRNEENNSRIILCCWEDAQKCYFLSNAIGNQIMMISTLSNMQTQVTNFVDTESDQEITTIGDEDTYENDKQGGELPIIIEPEEESYDTMEEEKGFVEKMEEEHTEKVIPKIVGEYLANMKGVDTFNQAASYYRFPHRHIRWYRTIIAWLIEVALNNAYLIYQKICSNEMMDPLKFRMSIIKAWEEEYEASKHEEETKNQTEEENNLKCQLGQQKNKSRGDCHYCSDRNANQRKRTFWICLNCEVYVCPSCSIQHFREKLRL
jgi:hypothetical protein